MKKARHDGVALGLREVGNRGARTYRGMPSLPLPVHLFRNRPLPLLAARAGAGESSNSRQGWKPARAETACGFGSRQPGPQGTPKIELIVASQSICLRTIEQTMSQERETVFSVIAYDLLTYPQRITI